MARVYAGYDETSESRSHGERCPSSWEVSDKDRWQRFGPWIGMLAVLCVTVLFSGWAGPLVPLSFGPPFDNLFGVLILVAVGAVIYKVFAPRLRGGTKGIAPVTAESIARERYARGEITQEQYNEILRTLAAR